MAVTDDDVEVLDTDEAGKDAFAAYFAEANKACDREVLQQQCSLVGLRIKSGFYVCMYVCMYHFIVEGGQTMFLGKHICSHIYLGRYIFSLV